MPRLVVTGHEPRQHERLRLRATLREPAFDEHDVEPLLHPSKGSHATCYKIVMEVRGDLVSPLP